MSNKTPKVSVCIPTFNTLDDLKKCIASVKASTRLPIEILVLDLGRDGTKRWCERNKIRVFKKKLPFFFSQSNNFLASKAKANLLLFLNPDTIVREGFLEEMVKESSPREVGVVGARLIYPNGLIQHAGVLWDGLPYHFGYRRPIKPHYLKSRDCPAVTGACMLIKRRAFNKVKGFDEEFQNGYEDVYLCEKARSLGFSVRYCGKAEVIHFESNTMGTDQRTPTSLQFYEHNKQLLLKKMREISKNGSRVGDQKKVSQDIPVESFRYISSPIIAEKSPHRRLLIGTPSTGVIRMEWALSRFGQIIPTNWSQVDHIQWMDATTPINYSVPDAQNVVVKTAMEKDFEWLLFIEHDVVLPLNTFIKMNEYVLKAKVPIVSGLYFTKSDPPEPIIYRGRGNSYYWKWKFGDKVWADGVPTGCLLIHTSILKVLWEESEWYMARNIQTKKIFEIPEKLEYDPENFSLTKQTGTTDLAFCLRVMQDRIFEKAGWPKFQEKRYPFLVDTNIFCKHIDINGISYPKESYLLGKKGPV